MNETRSPSPNRVEAVETRSRGTGLPDQLARLISPAAHHQRKEEVQARIADKTSERVSRQRSAEVIAKHLIDTDDQLLNTGAAPQRRKF